jgi:Oxaloacetate decarboxylase, gamma chain.
MIILQVSSRISSASEMWSNSGLAMAVVFTALTLLVLIFMLSGYLNTHAILKRGSKQSGEKIAVKDAAIPADEIAAIAMALRLYNEDYHDVESNVITIKQIKRSYSPWSSKSIRLLNSTYRK